VATPLRPLYPLLGPPGRDLLAGVAQRCLAGDVLMAAPGAAASAHIWDRLPLGAGGAVEARTPQHAEHLPVQRDQDLLSSVSRAGFRPTKSGYAICMHDCRCTAHTGQAEHTAQL
jgi:hypothetical protein